jgi:hypothetical protein
MSTEPKPVCRYPVPDVVDLPEDLRDRILEVQHKAGFVPNVFLALARRPAELRAFLAYHDALLLREESGLSKAEKEMVIVGHRHHGADPADAQRLADELPFFAPGLRVALFPDWETLPYDTFQPAPGPDQRAPGHAVAHLRNGDVDVVLLPATTALCGWRRRRSWPAPPSTSSRSQRLDEAG